MDDELGPEQAERVRRLLADARHTDPVPADVAARLDRVLAGLAAEEHPAASGASGEPATVVPLAQRRRRAGRLLLAAAAVVVGGVAVAQLGPSGGGLDSASDSGATADEAELQAPDRADGEEAASEPADEEVPGAVAEHQTALSKGPARNLRPGHFARDARRARASAVGRAADLADRPERGVTSARDAPCEPDAWGGGRYVPVRYGRTGGWLVVRPPVGDTQVVDLFLCGDDTAERSTTLPFR